MIKRCKNYWSNAKIDVVHLGQIPFRRIMSAYFQLEDKVITDTERLTRPCDRKTGKPVTFVI